MGVQKGLGWVVAPMALIMVGAGVVGFLDLPMWPVFAVGLPLSFVGALLFLRSQRADRERRGNAAAALVATGRWRSFGASREEPEPPHGLGRLPNHKPFGAGIEQTAGAWLGTTIDGIDVWSFEHGEVRRTYNADTRESGTTADLHHVVVVRLDKQWPFVEVSTAGAVDRLRHDVEVGVPEFDAAHRVEAESDDTARRWLGSQLGKELAGSLGDAMHGGRLRLHGRVLYWYRPGSAEPGVLDDVAPLVVRAAGYLPR